MSNIKAIENKINAARKYLTILKMISNKLNITAQTGKNTGGRN